MLSYALLIFILDFSSRFTLINLIITQTTHNLYLTPSVNNLMFLSDDYVTYYTAIIIIIQNIIHILHCCFNFAITKLIHI